jgi:hypothetical protein
MAPALGAAPRVSQPAPRVGAEARAQCDLLRDVFGPLPFRPVLADA